jgi:type VI secretion system secreted protein VgrG
MADDKLLEGGHIAFVSGAMKDDDIRLRGVRGRERLSALYEFDLLISRAAGPFTDDQLDALLHAPCVIAMGKNQGEIVHGLLDSIELVDATRNVAARYHAHMVPNVWLLTLARTNRIFQNVTVPKLVEKILTQYGFAKGTDFDILVTGSAVEHEYIVQYHETDWDFIQRWLEYEGFFYWFEHGDSKEKLVISNSNDDATPIDAPKTLSYRERNNAGTAGIATVWDWTLRQRRTSARVAVFDYNYRNPILDLLAKQDVDKRGFGSVHLYGEHFKTNDQGKALAKVRAEQLLSERRVFAGATDCARFRVGHAFELENHHEAEFDQKYLITSIQHQVGTPIRDEGGDVAPRRYEAKFACQPLSVAFRPARTTPWPRIDGVLHAHVEADDSGDYATLDDKGRYKVRLPFDGGDAKGSKGSRFIRMAQPYSGAGYGSHFPLHKGTEVLLAHIDGDPDRPIIVASVPNAHTASPSTSANATQSVIQTASGLRIEMEDRQS